MLSHLNCSKYLFFLNLLHAAVSMSLLKVNPQFSIASDTAQDVTDFIINKGYYPNEKDLPKASMIKNVDNDATYLLSKLSDEDLIKLLNEQPNKNVYNVNDIVKFTTSPKSSPLNKLTKLKNPIKNQLETAENFVKNLKKNSFQSAHAQEGPFFRLENKEVDPFALPKGGETQVSAVQKINNLFYSRPSESESKTDDDNEQKELIFDVLVGQLKALCCKRNRSSNNSNPKHALKSFLNNVMPQTTSSLSQTSDAKTLPNTSPNENLFLILNDEIKTKANDEDELILVDPDSLGKNSSVLLLGPIATPLSDAQLKVVMMRISSELSKLEYLPLLQQISEGTLSGENKGLMNSLISGHQTRRYIKPHRCNHQSKLARIYGGPKWLICTGYLNLNGPSIYD